MRSFGAFLAGFFGVVVGIIVLLGLFAAIAGTPEGAAAHDAGQAAGRLAVFPGGPIGIVVGVLLARRSTAKQNVRLQQAAAFEQSRQPLMASQFAASQVLPANTYVAAPAAPATVATAAAAAPAGWYLDGAGTTRWWDGLQWTQHTHPSP